MLLLLNEHCTLVLANIKLAQVTIVCFNRCYNYCAVAWNLRNFYYCLESAKFRFLEHNR
jgi:hypothetical protein